MQSEYLFSNMWILPDESVVFEVETGPGYTKKWCRFVRFQLSGKDLLYASWRVDKRHNNFSKRESVEQILRNDNDVKFQVEWLIEMREYLPGRMVVSLMKLLL